MQKLIGDGHIYVARPPLFKITHKKQVRFVQTIEEMSKELMERGLAGSKLEVLDVGEPKSGVPRSTVYEGERLAKLTRVLGELEDALQILERRGLGLPSFLARATAGPLPTHRVLLSGKEHWFTNSEEVEKFRKAEQEKAGRDLVVADEPQVATNGNGHAETPAITFFVQDLHEVRNINQGLERLREFNLGASDLIPAPRVAGREPPIRFILENGDQKRPLPHLRVLVPDIRKFGEKGMSITRFKGLGEMDPEELWETTLDPQKRTLMKVQMDDALKVEDMFRTLMGEKVEPRRDFIQKHALEVKEIDYHGA